MVSPPLPPKRGVFTYRRPLPFPLPRFQIRKLDVLRCGSRPRLARYLRRRSRPRITGRGARGCDLGPPNTRSGRRGSTGVPDEAGPSRASVATRSCQALAPRAGYLPFLCGGRGGASQLPGWEGGRPTPRNSQILPQTKIAGIQLGIRHRAMRPLPNPMCLFAAWIPNSRPAPVEKD